MELTVYLSMVTAALSFLAAESSVFAPVREWAAKKHALLGKLASCCYCLGHWVAFILAALYKPRLFELWWLLDYVLTALAVAWLAAFQSMLLCVLMNAGEKKE